MTDRQTQDTYTSQGFLRHNLDKGHALVEETGGGDEVEDSP